MNTHNLILLWTKFLLHFFNHVFWNESKNCFFPPFISLFSAPGCYSRGESNVCSFNNRTYAENEAGWDVSVQYLKWEACESCSINKSRDGSFTHKLKHPPAINFPVRTSMESIPSLKQHFYDYKTILSLGLFSLFHLLRLSAKSLFPANDEFALILPGHLFTWRESISWIKIEFKE